MQLRLESRPVGEVLIVQCHGRIVAGNEVFTLHSQVGDSVEKYGDVVLQLDQVEFVDSSGLGALVRLMRAARLKGGDLKLSGLQPRIRKMLELTSLRLMSRWKRRSRRLIWARAIRGERPGTRVRGCFACSNRSMCARSCGKCCAGPATMRSLL